MKILEDTDSTEALFLMIKSNKKNAFEYIYKKYGAILYGMALSSASSGKTAEKMVESTFLKLWRGEESNCKTSVGTFIIQLHLKTIKEYEANKLKCDIPTPSKVSISDLFPKTNGDSLISQSQNIGLPT